MESQQEQLVLDNLRLAYWVVRRQYRHSGVDLDDLDQVGILGLIKAARSYDAAQGAVFSSYAVECVKNTLRSYLAKQAPREGNLSLPSLSAWSRTSLPRLRPGWR